MSLSGSCNEVVRINYSILELQKEVKIITCVEYLGHGSTVQVTEREGNFCDKELAFVCEPKDVAQYQIILQRKLE